MDTSSSSSGVWFPQWAEVLSRARLKDLERRTYRLAIVQYLVFCKRSRQRATVASAREFMEQVEGRRRLGVRQLATWKLALNWFFNNSKQQTDHTLTRPSTDPYLTPTLSLPSEGTERGETSGAHGVTRPTLGDG
jgi:hypothetical protein